MHFGKGMENSHRSGIILLVGFSSLGHVHARGLVRHRNGRLMALWWIIRPVSIYVTAFVPIVVNAFFNLISNSHVISQYFSEIAVLLLGSDLICLTWTTTGLDKRVSVKALCFIGTSMKNQIFVWFLASTVLSIFLPNVVVAAIFCPIAVAMLRSLGEDDVTESRMALPILLAIGWGSGIGGFGSPIGSSANLVAVSYIEKLTGHEFMYYDWVIRFLPLLAIVFLLNLIFLWLIPAPAKDLPGTRAYFREMYSKFGTMRRGEKIGLYLFILATALAFIRPLFASFPPAMKPAYVFLVIGMLMFFLHDENGKTMLDWQYAESHAMWGMIFLFASGLALGRLVIETGAIDRLAGHHRRLPASARTHDHGYFLYLRLLSLRTFEQHGRRFDFHPCRDRHHRRHGRQPHPVYPGDHRCRQLRIHSPRFHKSDSSRLRFESIAADQVRHPPFHPDLRDDHHHLHALHELFAALQRAVNLPSQ